MSSKNLLKLDPFAAALARRGDEEAPPNPTAPPNFEGAVNLEAAPASVAPAEDGAPINHVAATENAAAVIPIAPPNPAAGAENRGATKNRGGGLQNTGAVKSVAAAAETGATILPFDAPHTRTPNVIEDELLPTLKPPAQAVLRRLYRLSAGFGTSRCKVSVPKLALMCNMSESSTRAQLKILYRRRLVKKINEDNDNANQQERGIEFAVLLPRLARSKSEAPTEFAGATGAAGATGITGNKRKTLKDKDQKEDRCARCKDTGGFLYPRGPGGGVIKCDHKDAPATPEATGA